MTHARSADLNPVHPPRRPDGMGLHRRPARHREPPHATLQPGHRLPTSRTEPRGRRHRDSQQQSHPPPPHIPARHSDVQPHPTAVPLPCAQLPQLTAAGPLPITAYHPQLSHGFAQHTLRRSHGPPTHRHTLAPFQPTEPPTGSPLPDSLQYVGYAHPPLSAGRYIPASLPDGHRMLAVHTARPTVPARPTAHERPARRGGLLRRAWRDDAGHRPWRSRLRVKAPADSDMLIGLIRRLAQRECRRFRGGRRPGPA